MTPQVVDTARHAGIVAFGGSAVQMEGIYDMIVLSVPECLPPHDTKNDFIFVARWAGKFRIIGRDVDLAYAAQGDPYLLASSYANLDPSAPRNEQNGWKTKRQLQEMHDKTLIDIMFDSWKYPSFGSHVGVALTPHPSSGGLAVHSTAGTAYTDRRRDVRARISLHYKNPFSVERGKEPRRLIPVHWFGG